MQIGITMFATDYAIPPHELAMEAEARGYESVWFPEHSHIPTSRKSPWPGGAELPKWYYDTYDPFLAMAAAAVVTKTIKLGTGVCLVVQRDPIHTAKEVSTVDRLSNGRLLFGIGGGWNAEEMADHGTAFGSRFKLMRERIEAMKEIWAKSKPKYSGEMVKFDEMMQWPKPVQKPHPPVMIGGGGEQLTLRAVARLANACNVGGTPAMVRHKLDVLRRHCETQQRNYDDIERTNIVSFVVARDEAQLAAKRRRLAVPDHYYGVAGTVAQIIDLVGQYQDAGVQLLISSAYKNDSETFEFLAADVMPRFAGQR